MNLRGWASRLARDWAIVALSLVAAATASYFALREPAARPFALSITAGSAEGARHRVAEALRREAAPAGIALRVSASAGSEAALDDVDRRRLDLARSRGAWTSAAGPTCGRSPPCTSSPCTFWSRVNYTPRSRPIWTP